MIFSLFLCHFPVSWVFFCSPFCIHLSAEPPLTVKLWRRTQLYVNVSPHSHCSQFRNARSLTYIWFVNLKKKKKNHQHCQGIKRGKRKHWVVGLVSLATGNSDSNTFMGNKSWRSSPSSGSSGIFNPLIKYTNIGHILGRWDRFVYFCFPDAVFTCFFF